MVDKKQYNQVYSDNILLLDKEQVAYRLNSKIGILFKLVNNDLILKSETLELKCNYVKDEIEVALESLIQHLIKKKKCLRNLIVIEENQLKN